MAIGAVSAISGSSRQIIWKASKPVSDRVRPEPGWHRNIIAVSNYPPARTTLPPPFTGVEQLSDDIGNPKNPVCSLCKYLKAGSGSSPPRRASSSAKPSPSSPSATPARSPRSPAPPTPTHRSSPSTTPSFPRSSSGILRRTWQGPNRVHDP